MFGLSLRPNVNYKQIFFWRIDETDTKYHQMYTNERIDILNSNLWGAGSRGWLGIFWLALIDD